MRLVSYIAWLLLLAGVARAGESSLRSWELGEAAKARYRAGDWPAFFGLALYVERHAPELDCAPQVRLLEALARLRHCRWAEASRLASEPAIAGQAAPLQAFLELQPGLVEQPSRIAPPAFSRRRWFWQLSEPREKDPLQWRVVVESLCPEGQ
jgi:hypothetical protein